MAKITHIPLPPLEFLEEFLILDPASPSGLRWKKLQQPCQRKPGDVAGGHSYKGYWNTACNKWLAKIGVNRKRIHLGVFIHEIDAAQAYNKHEIDAAQAYNKAALKYFGDFAKINELEE